jgi:hypothetical protein
MTFEHRQGEPRPELDERFADWVDGRLKASERAALEAELARDPALRQQADEYRRNVQLLRSALAPGELGESLAAGVMANLAPAPRAARPPRAWRPYLASAIAAAALVLVLVVVRTIPPAAPQRADVAHAPATQAAEQERARDGDVLDRLEGVRPAPRQADEKPAPTEAPPALAESRPVQGARANAENAAPVRAQPEVEARARLHAGAQRKDEPKEEGVAADDLAAGAAGRGKDSEANKEADKEADAGRTPRGAPLLDQLALGEVAVVAEVAVPHDGKLWREIDARAARITHGAEMLAMLGAPVHVEAQTATVDLRGVQVVRAELAQAALAAASGTVAESRPSSIRDAEQSTLPSLTLQPGDRVFIVSGAMAELRAFTASVQARVTEDQGRVALQRYAVPPTLLAQAQGDLAEKMLGREGQFGADGRARAATARDPSTTAAPPEAAAPGSAAPNPVVTGPMTPGPPAGARASTPAGNKDRAAGDDRARILLILRAAGRR